MGAQWEGPHSFSNWWHTPRCTTGSLRKFRWALSPLGLLFTFPRRSGVSGRARVPARRVLQYIPEPCIFTLELPELAPEPRIFTLELDPEPPIFHFSTAHTYQNLGWVPPPPPPPPPRFSFVNLSWILIKLGGNDCWYRNISGAQRPTLGKLEGFCNFFFHDIV